MVRNDVFCVYWSYLVEWFRVEFDDPGLIKIYKVAVDRELTEEQFIQAVSLAIEMRDPVPQKLPCARALIELVLGTPEERAFQDWTIALCAANASELDTESILEDISETGRKALREIGGPRKIGMAPTSEMEWVKKAFVAAWVRDHALAKRTSTHLSLPSTGVDLRLLPDALLEANAN